MQSRWKKKGGQREKKREEKGEEKREEKRGAHCVMEAYTEA